MTGHTAFSDFLERGLLRGIWLGCTRADVVEAWGPPEDRGARKLANTLWAYAARGVQIHFDEYRVIFIGLYFRGPEQVAGVWTFLGVDPPFPLPMSAGQFARFVGSMGLAMRGDPTVPHFATIGAVRAIFGDDGLDSLVVTALEKGHERAVAAGKTP